MSSQATADGVMQLTVTFALGTDVDLAQVQVQNRVNQALPRLPEEVRRLGVATVKSSPDLTMVVHLTSPNRRYDVLYLRNYALIQIRDVLARLPDMGNVRIFGGGDYAMRIWLDPAKVAARNLTAAEVVQAVQQQNVQVSAGILGGPPLTEQIAVPAHHQHPGPAARRGGVRRGRDPDRPRRPADPAARRRPDRAGRPGLRAPVRPGQQAGGPDRASSCSRAGTRSQLAERVRATMAELSQNFPEGVSYEIVYDPTVFVSESIREVVMTLFEAVLLVVIVVVLFLQTWRASIIPLVAVPVSIVGTFAVLLGVRLLHQHAHAVRPGARHRHRGGRRDRRGRERGAEHRAGALSPRRRRTGPWRRSRGPIIAIALVLCAVFVPVALLPGFTGQFYRQFALTIAFSTVISAFNSLTLSPALAAILLRPHGAPRDRLTRRAGPRAGLDLPALQPGLQDRLGALRRGGGAPRHRGRAGPSRCTPGCWRSRSWSSGIVPGGFIPAQDKQYLVGIAQLPDASSLDRTDSVLRKMTAIALEHPAVSHAVQFTGLSVNGFVNAPNQGIVFFPLKPFEEREEPELHGPAVAQALNARSPRFRRRSSPCSRRRRFRGSGPPAASRCRCRIAAHWASVSCFRPPRR